MKGRIIANCASVAWVCLCSVVATLIYGPQTCDEGMAWFVPACLLGTLAAYRRWHPRWQSWTAFTSPFEP